MSAELSNGLPLSMGLKSEKFHEDLTQIDREASDLEVKIAETKKELDGVNSLILKYEGIQSDLSSKLQTLEGQRKNCLLRKNTLLATHDVFGTPISSDPNASTSSSPFFLPSPVVAPTKSILLSKLNGEGHQTDRSHAGDIQEMVSELFSESNIWSDHSKSVFNSCFSLHDTLFNNQQQPNGVPESSVNGVTSFCRALTTGLNSSSSTAFSSCNVVSNHPTTFSEAVGSQGNHHQQQSQVQPNTTLSSFDSQSNSGSLSPLSNFGLNSKDLEEGDVEGSLSLPPTPSLTASQSSSNSQSLSSNSNSNSSCNSHQSSSSQYNGTSQQRFILQRQCNGTQVAVGQSRSVTYNSVLALETSQNGYVYKSLADHSVCRFRFGNMKDIRSFPGHMDKVKVLCLDLTHNLLFTGCDDGKARCFNINTGSALSEFQAEGSIIAIEKAWDHSLVLATNKGWVYMVKNQLSQVVASHRVFNWICCLKPLLTTSLSEFKNRKVLLLLPMKHRPSLVDAVDGKVLKEIDTNLIETKPCLQVNGGICIMSTVTDKNETAKSVISVFDAGQDWACIQRIKKDGVVAALRIYGTELYVGLKFPSFGHIECYRWANKNLSLKWIACVAYVSCIAVLPNDIVLNGGPDGTVYNTTPNLKGPFPCTNAKCKCKQPFARRKDLEFHYSKVSGSSSPAPTGTS